MDALVRAIYGSKSEKIDPAQLELLLSGGKEDDSKKPEAPSDDDGGDNQEPEAEGKKSTPKRAPQRSRIRGIENLPVEESISIPPEVQADPEAYEQIGEEITEQLDHTPSRSFLRRTIRPKFRHKEHRHQPPILAPAPPGPLVGGLPAPGLAAELLAGRFLLHLPLYRQREEFARGGVEIPSDLIDRWLLGTLSMLEPIAQAIRKEVLSHPYLQVDESTHPYLIPGLGRSKDGYMWVLEVPDGPCSFHWDTTRARKALKETLGEEYEGTLGTDGYQVYISYSEDNSDRVILSSCMAHIRRKFVDVAKGPAPKEVGLILHLFSLLYKLEADLRNTRAGPALRAAIRASHAAPIIHRLEKIFKLLQRRHRPSSPMGQALSYALSRWPDTQAYLEDGLVEIDNNLVENRIRPLKIGKKNSLFFGSAGAGHQYAIGYTITETVKKYGLDLRSYLVQAISQLATHGPQVAEQITPRSLTEHPNAIHARVKEAV